MPNPFNSIGAKNVRSAPAKTENRFISTVIGGGDISQAVSLSPTTTGRNEITLGSVSGSQVGWAVISPVGGIYSTSSVVKVVRGDGTKVFHVELGSNPAESSVYFVGNAGVVFQESPLQFKNSAGTKTVTINQPTTWTSSYSLILPGNTPGTNTYLKHTSGGQLVWDTVAGGGGGGSGNSYFPSGW